MNSSMNQYFGLQGGLSYKSFLKHFTDQAEGSANLQLMRNLNSLKGDARFKKPAVNNSLILVSLASSENTNAKNEKQPAIEVYDESESARRRAQDKVVDETIDLQATPVKQVKRTVSGSKSHSQTNFRHKRSTSGTDSNAAISARKAIKRTRDIFEKD